MRGWQSGMQMADAVHSWNDGDIIVTSCWRQGDIQIADSETSNSFFAGEKIAYANRATRNGRRIFFHKIRATKFPTEISVTRVSDSGYFAYFSALAGARNIIRTGRSSRIFLSEFVIKLFKASPWFRYVRANLWPRCSNMKYGLIALL